MIKRMIMANDIVCCPIKTHLYTSLDFDAVTDKQLQPEDVLLVTEVLMIDKYNFVQVFTARGELAWGRIERFMVVHR